jgi:hypothetical protein
VRWLDAATNRVETQTASAASPGVESPVVAAAVAAVTVAAIDAVVVDVVDASKQWSAAAATMTTVEASYPTRAGESASLANAPRDDRQSDARSRGGSSRRQAVAGVGGAARASLEAEIIARSLMRPNATTMTLSTMRHPSSGVVASRHHATSLTSLNVFVCGMSVLKLL